MGKRKGSADVTVSQESHVTLEMCFGEGAGRFYGTALIVGGEVKKAEIRAGSCGSAMNLTQWFKNEKRVKALLKFLKAVQRQSTPPSNPIAG